MLLRLAGILAALSLALGSPALAQNIDTRAAATGIIPFFGHNPPRAVGTTFGQTFTVPAGQGSISTFTVKIADVDISTVTFRTYLAQWDAGTNRPTGAILYESNDVSTVGLASQEFTFTPAVPVPVTAGQTYVVFGSTEQTVGDGALRWSRTPGDDLAGGAFVTAGAGGPANWTARTWFPNAYDTGFAATFQPAAAPVPTLSEWALILFGLMLAGGAALYIERHRMAV